MRGKINGVLILWIRCNQRPQIGMETKRKRIIFLKFHRKSLFGMVAGGEDRKLEVEFVNFDNNKQRRERDEAKRVD